jgi:hypothetical protein
VLLCGELIPLRCLVPGSITPLVVLHDCGPGGRLSNDLDDWKGRWLVCLVREMGRAAEAGNAKTARLIALLAVAVAAVALIVEISR